VARSCKHCGRPLDSSRRKGTRYCDVSCRARACLSRKRRRARGKAKGGRLNVSRAAKRRADTTYHVYLLLDEHGGTLMHQGKAEAHDPDAAVAAVVGGLDGQFVALPVRSLKRRKAG
jgi:hypothetical protein